MRSILCGYMDVVADHDMCFTPIEDGVSLLESNYNRPAQVAIVFYVHDNGVVCGKSESGTLREEQRLSSGSYYAEQSAP